MLVDWLYVAVFGVVGVLLAILPLAIVWLISPRGEYPQKLLTYESGVVPFGQAWSQFNVRYYLFSLAFVLFDVEVIYLYPWAIVFKELGAFAFTEMFVFLAILFIALVYAWRKGALEWV
jgi:NAD(P)H-quinone oxidoreductase subunit 3